MDSKRRVKSVMQIEHMRILIRKLYRKPASKVAAMDRRFLVQQMFLFFGMHWYGDIKEVIVRDVSLLERSDVEVYVRM